MQQGEEVVGATYICNEILGVGELKGSRILSLIE